MSTIYSLNKRKHTPSLNQKVLVLSSRGVTARQRFLMNDLCALLPHSKRDTKLDTKTKLFELNELADLNNANNILFFEARKHTDLYIHLAKAPNGPKIKLHVQNIHTMDELNMTGNCLKGSRPILSFDAGFDGSAQYRVLKELLMHVFQVPKGARRSKPFVDHIITFSINDGKVWFRNFQIQEREHEGVMGNELIEIGPRFCMTLIHIIEGSFTGPVIYENKQFVHPNQVRRVERLTQAEKYKSRQRAAEDQKVKKSGLRESKSELDNDVLFA